MKAKILAVVAILALTGIQANAQCKGKCRNGFGTFTFESGETYTGNFVDGKFEGRELTSSNQVPFMKENTRLVSATVKVSSLTLPVMFTKVLSLMESQRAKAYITTLTVINMRVSSRMVRSTETVFTHLRAVPSKQESSRMAISSRRSASSAQERIVNDKSLIGEGHSFGDVLFCLYPRKYSQEN